MIEFVAFKDSNKIHNIHPYPAKFPPSIPNQIINKLAKAGQTILDPFCGCGTTLTEGLLNNCNVIGNDINFIGLLISHIKTTMYDENDLKKVEDTLLVISNNFEQKIQIVNPTNFKGIEHWFQNNVAYELDVIKTSIIDQPEKIKNLIKLIISCILIEVSNQESDTRYAAINKNIKTGYTIEALKKKYQSLKNIVLDFQYNSNLNAKILCEDARKLKSIENNSVDMIITSPPYANTYDYYLYHKHRMNWLDFDYKFSQDLEIGSRNEYSSKKQPKEKWIADMNLFLTEMKRVIKPGGYISLVIGDSVINKELFDAKKHLNLIAKEHKLTNFFQTSELLSKNSKKFNFKFRSPYKKKEHILIFKNGI